MQTKMTVNDYVKLYNLPMILNFEGKLRIAKQNVLFNNYLHCKVKNIRIHKYVERYTLLELIIDKKETK